jgi:glycosyltransferase involved in cell wall biosynthesis
MLISIVTGTYNRLDILQSMMESVRVQMHPGIAYEFIVVDGGSTDGTIEWLNTQPHATIIQHGELRGAIKAFCDGARAATGEYVIMANDDIEFGAYSVLAALAHLESNPGCGAVAFADNRHKRHEYNVMYHPVITAKGDNDFAPFAQVGMFRRWLGELAGWWGDEDEIISQSRTYGGDNYLSSRIWEMGYTVETCPDCVCHDLIFRDELRAINSSSGERDSQLYYTRFPNGAQFGADKNVPLPDGYPNNRLRILYLPIYEGNHAEQRRQKRGLRRALERVGIVLEYDYVLRAHSNLDVTKELSKITGTFRPHVVLTQFQGVPDFASEFVRVVRESNSDTVLINWNGDYWPDVSLSSQMVDLLRWYDLALCVNLNVIEQHRELGIRAGYWQVASEEPQTFPDVPEYDIIFLANAYSEERKQIEDVLRLLPYRVGLFGSGWQQSDGNTLYDYATSHALMAKAKICIGDNQFKDGSAFVSNRVFETLHAGGFLLHQKVPGLYQATRIRVGQHYAAWDTLEELPGLIDEWMKDDAKREKIRTNGQWFVRTKHSFDARVKELFLELIPMVGRQNGRG